MTNPIGIKHGSVTVHVFPEGYASCADDGGWVSALFTSSESALSWKGHYVEAEALFRDLNKPTGKGNNYVPARQ